MKIALSIALFSTIVVAPLRAVENAFDVRVVRSANAPITENAADESPIQLRNVKPSIMAYWLDSVGQPEPREIVQQRASLAKMGVTEGFLTEKWLRVSPAPDIMNCVTLRADDQTNTLLVGGDSSAIERLRAVVAGLDKPIPIFEIEARVVQVARNSPLYHRSDKTLPYIRTSWEVIKKLEAAGGLHNVAGWKINAFDGSPGLIGNSTTTQTWANFNTKNGVKKYDVSVVKQHLIGFRAVIDGDKINLFTQSYDGFRLGEPAESKGRLVEPLTMQVWRQSARLQNGAVICFSGAPIAFLQSQEYPQWLRKRVGAASVSSKEKQLLVVSVRLLDLQTPAQ